jgi:hypothetical protein
MEVNEEAHRHVCALSFDCGWSLLSHGAAEIIKASMSSLESVTIGINAYASLWNRMVSGSSLGQELGHVRTRQSRRRGAAVCIVVVRQ